MMHGLHGMRCMSARVHECPGQAGGGGRSVRWRGKRRSDGEQAHLAGSIKRSRADECACGEPVIANVM